MTVPDGGSATEISEPTKQNPACVFLSAPIALLPAQNASWPGPPPSSDATSKILAPALSVA